MIELETLLSPESYTRLKEEANRRQVVIGDVVRDALEAYAHALAALGDDENPSDEVILEKIRAGFEDIKAGRIYPASEMMERLRARRKHD